MNNESQVTSNDKSFILNIIGWLFGLVFFGVGLVNMFWGNDFFFGVLHSRIHGVWAST